MLLRRTIVMQTVVVATIGRGDGVTAGTTAGTTGAWLDAVTFGAPESAASHGVTGEQHSGLSFEMVVAAPTRRTYLTVQFDGSEIANVTMATVLAQSFCGAVSEASALPGCAELNMCCKGGLDTFTCPGRSDPPSLNHRLGRGAWAHSFALPPARRRRRHPVRGPLLQPGLRRPVPALHLHAPRQPQQHQRLRRRQGAAHAGASAGWEGRRRALPAGDCGVDPPHSVARAAGRRRDRSPGATARKNKN